MSVTSNCRVKADLDAAGRLRVGEPEALFDSKQIFDNLPLFWDDSEVSGGSTTSVWNGPTARTRIGVANTTAGKRVRQTFSRWNYQPGKGHLIYLTGILGDGGVGLTQEIGYGDDNDGLFFQVAEGVLGVVRRSNVTGSPVDETIAQSDWNLDKLDGTGPSGLVLDLAKTHLFVIDFEWLGVGQVRYGIFFDGDIHYCHTFDHTNDLGEVFMSTPNLPCRYSIENDGTGAAATLDHICTSVMVEGGTQELGTLHYKSTEGAVVSMTTENTLYAILGIRLKSTHLGMASDIVRLAVALQSASDDIEYVLMFDPTIAGPPSWTAKANSAMEFFLGATANTITNGEALDGGFLATGTGQSASAFINEDQPDALRIGSKIDGTQQTIVLCARPINGSETAVLVEGALTWREMD